MTIQGFLHNWPEKLISIIIATGIWVYATLGVNSIVTFPGKVSIEFRNTGAQLVAMTDQDELSITIKSDSVNLKRLTSDNFKAYVDLVGLSAGVYEKDVAVESKNDQVQIVDKNPKKITIRVEPLVTKEVPVKVVFSSRAANGYSATEKSTTPKETQASGPESEMNRLAYGSATVKLSGEDKDFERSFILRGETADGDELSNIKFNPPSVNVSVLVSSATATKTVAIRAITSGEIADGFQISDIKYDPGFVTITGPADTVAGLRIIETKPIDISSLKESATLSGSLNLPTGIILEDKINQVKVTFTISSADAIKKISVSLKAVNIEPGQNIDLEQDTVEITLRGPNDILSALNPDSYQARLDLSGISNSSVSVPVSAPAVLPDKVEFVGSNPSSVKATAKGL